MADLVTFPDGTTYCDGGHQVERRLFWWYHADGQLCAHMKQPQSLAEVVIRMVATSSPSTPESEQSRSGPGR
jgi:hypothetical protein